MLWGVLGRIKIREKINYLSAYNNIEICFIINNVEKSIQIKKKDTGDKIR